MSIAVLERFTKVLGVEHLRSAKDEVHPTRESVYMDVPLIIARASADAQGRRRIFHAAIHGLGGKRLAKPSRPDPVFEVFDGAIDRCVASTGPREPVGRGPNPCRQSMKSLRAGRRRIRSSRP